MSEIAAEARALVDGLADDERDALRAELAAPIGPTTRRKWAAEHRTALMAMLETPTIKQVATRTWRTELWTGDAMHAVLLAQAVTLPPNADPSTTPRISVQVTTGADAAPHHVRFLGLATRTYDLADVVAFLRLDTVDPATVQWRDTTNYREIITVESALATAIGAHIKQ